jgi:hypothetical protein
MRWTTPGKAAMQEWLADPAFVPVEAREYGCVRQSAGSSVSIRSVGPRPAER